MELHHECLLLTLLSTDVNTTNLDLIPRLEPLSYVKTNILNIAYYEAGPPDGLVVILLHGVLRYQFLY
jgi:hypothetical protein